VRKLANTYRNLIYWELFLGASSCSYNDPQLPFRALSHTVINAQTLRVYMFITCHFILQKAGSLLLIRCSEGRYTERGVTYADVGKQIISFIVQAQCLRLVNSKYNNQKIIIN
jgi:hypothetical protein